MEPSTFSFNGATSSPSNPDGWTPPSSRRRNGHIAQELSSSSPALLTPNEVATAIDLYDDQYLPGHSKSLAGIAARAFLLGTTLALCASITLHVALAYDTGLWRAPLFIATLALFHFLEFWATARYNTRAAHTTSFLLSRNGAAYKVAHTSALVECVLTHLCFPGRRWLPAWLGTALLVLGAVGVAVGQLIRSAAMGAAGTNFNHIVQRTKASSHRLVTDGVYAYLRHPSYFGFFWWGLGTQLLLGNPVCFVGYAVVLWKFFSERIRVEEKFLVEFFGDEYVLYKGRTPVGIPFIR